MNRKVSKAEALGMLTARGVSFADDYHTLRSEQVELLAEAARACRYRKPRNANGSTARCFFYHLAKLA